MSEPGAQLFELEDGTRANVPADKVATWTKRMDARGVGYRPAQSDPAPEPEPTTPAPPPKVGTGEALTRGAAQGASLGLADEASGFGAWLAGLADNTPRATRRGVDAPVMGTAERAAESYAGVRDAERAANVQAAKDTAFDKTGMNPLLDAVTPNSMFGVGELGGTLATSALPVGGGAARTAGLLARAKAAAKAGAGIGAAAGFGHAEGGPVRQAAYTAAGGAAGAALAPVAAEIARGVGKGAGAVMEGIDRLRGGGAPARAVTYGGPEAARAAEELAAPTTEGQAKRALALAGQDTKALDRAATEIADKASKLWEHGDVIKWNEDIASKRPIVRKMIEQNGIDPTATITAADQSVGKAAAALEDMASYVEKGTPDRTLINKLQKEIAEYSKRPIEGGDYDAATDRFMRVDQVKREFQRALDSASKQRGSAVIDQLRGIEGDLRGHLEDPAAYGEGAAAMQQVRNKGWRNRLLLESRDASPERVFMTDASGESAMDPYRTKMIGDPAKMKAVLDSAGTVEGAKNVRALREWADREAGLLEALAQHSEDASIQARAKQAREVATQIHGVLEQRIKTNTATEELSSVRAAEQAHPERPGLTRRVAEKIPLLKEFVPEPAPTLGERAQRMGEAERALQQGPNRAAERQLTELGPMADRAGTGGAQTAGRAGALPAQAMRPEQRRTNSPVDKAVDDPTYGPMLSAHEPGQARDIVYSTLLTQDPAFRERERARAQEQTANNED